MNPTEMIAVAKREHDKSGCTPKSHSAASHYACLAHDLAVKMEKMQADVKDWLVLENELNDTIKALHERVEKLEGMLRIGELAQDREDGRRP